MLDTVGRTGMRSIPIRSSPPVQRARRSFYPFDESTCDDRDRTFLAISAEVRSRSPMHVDASIGRIFASSMSIDDVVEEVNNRMRMIYLDMPRMEVLDIDREVAKRLARILTTPDRQYGHLFLIPDETLRLGLKATRLDSQDDLPLFLDATAT